MTVYTTEITSDQIPSDNPIHQRLLQAYHLAVPFISGDLLELGCGEGRGIDLIAPRAKSYSAIDKIGAVIDQLQEKYPDLDKQELVQRYGRPLQQLHTLASQHEKTLEVLQRITTNLANGNGASEALEAYTNHVLAKIEEAQASCGHQLIDVSQ